MNIPDIPGHSCPEPHDSTACSGDSVTFRPIPSFLNLLLLLRTFATFADFLGVLSGFYAAFGRFLPSFLGYSGSESQEAPVYQALNDQNRQK